MDKVKNVSIEWESSGYSVLKNLNASIVGIFTEFIDNSIQSYKNDKEKIKKTDPDYRLKIKIKRIGDEIIIEDNAGGIDEIRSVQYIYQCISRGNSQDEAIENALKLANHDYPNSNYINIPDEQTDNWRFIENYDITPNTFNSRSAIKINDTTSNTGCVFYTKIDPY